MFSTSYTNFIPTKGYNVRDGIGYTGTRIQRLFYNHKLPDQTKPYWGRDKKNSTKFWFNTQEKNEIPQIGWEQT